MKSGMRQSADARVFSYICGFGVCVYLGWVPSVYGTRDRTLGESGPAAEAGPPQLGWGVPLCWLGWTSDGR